MITINVTYKNVRPHDDMTQMTKDTLTSIIQHPMNLPFIASFVECDVWIVSAPYMRGINNQYGKHDTPTNVLSFPSYLEIGHPVQYLGDIFLALSVIKKEAHHLHIPLDEHMKHLLIHGLLHLLGFDHDNDSSASCMEQKEIQLLKVFHIPSPYEDSFIKKQKDC